MTTQTRAESALLATTLIWGSTFVFVKIGLEDISPVLMTGVRFLLAAAAFLALFNRQLFPITREEFVRAFVLGFFLYLGFISQNIGLTITTASKSAFITSLMVVFVPIIQFLVEKRSPTWGNILGIIVVLAGLWLMTSPSGGGFNIGDGLTLICAILFAYYIVYLDIASKMVSVGKLAFVQTVVAGVFGILSALAAEEMRFTPTFSMISSMIYLTVFATVITTYVQTRYQKDTTPTRAAIIFTIEPVWASAFAAIALAERLGWLEVGGAVLIITGVLISELSITIPGLNKPAVAHPMKS